MVNLAINNIVKSSVPLSKKSEQTALGTQKNTFENVLLETIDNKTAANKILNFYRAGYAFSAADTDYIEAEAETDEVVSSYIEPTRKKSWDEITKYQDVEINGRWVKQVTDEYLEFMGYNVEVLEANNIIKDNLLNYIDGNGVVPRFLIPLDISYATDYTMTFATSENLEKTAKNNAHYDSMAAKTASVVNINKQITNQNYEMPPSKTAVKENTVSQSYEKSMLKESNVNQRTTFKEVVQENSIIQSNAQKPSIKIEKTENTVKTIINNSALRVLYNLNNLNNLSVLDIWDSKDKEDEHK